MFKIEEYKCPRCGFAFKLELNAGEFYRVINCHSCKKVMNIQNRFQVVCSNMVRKKVHYLHKSLLN